MIKKLQIPLALLLSALLLASCVQIMGPQNSNAEHIIKSVNDPREYQFVTLDNGVKVLLVSDPDTAKAAVSIDVNVGSWADPEGREGLVHFLEHMLFLKSEKYPTLDGYRKFIRSRGGSNNAVTYGQTTNYHFEINAEHLQPALDRLAHSVALPILDATYVDRERHAVNSEFRMNFKNDGWRKYIAQGMVTDPKHPFAGFSTGTLQTLNNDDGKTLLQDLKNLHQQFYVGGNMTAAVYGKEPLQTLEDWAKESLAIVPAGERAVYRYPSEPALAEQQGVRINIETLEESRELTLEFFLPTAVDLYREKPLAYLGFVFGTEGPGSLHSVLKKQGLIESLSVSNWDYEGAFSQLGITMELTEAGFSELESVTEAVFAYIELLRKQGISEKLFQSQAKLAELEFRFLQKYRTRDYAITLAERLQNFPAQYAVSLPFSYERFDRGAIKRYLDLLTPQRMRLIVAANKVAVDQVEPFYLTRYSVQPLPTNLLQRLQAPATVDGLAVPGVNPYMPEQIALTPKAQESRDEPALVVAETGVSLWHLQDQRFQQPRSDVFINFSSAQASQTPEDRIKMVLLTMLLGRELNEQAYLAAEAGLYLNLNSLTSGFAIRLSGFSDKMPLLLAQVAETMKSARFTAKAFASEKALLARNQANFALASPDDQAYLALMRLVNVGTYNDKVLQEALQGISLEDVNDYRSSYFAKAHLTVMVHGNTSQQEAVAMTETLSALVKTPAEAFYPSIYDLAASPQVRLELDIDHSDSVSVLYYQSKDESVKTRAVYALLAEMLSSDFFRELRTNQQLGYVVWGSAARFKDRPGLVFLIQSPSTGPDELKRRMTSFFEAQRNEMMALDEKTLALYKQGLVDDIRKKALNLPEQSERFWKQIQSEKVDFNSSEKFAKAIENVSLQELQSAYQQALMQKDALSVEIKSYGTDHEKEVLSHCVGATCVDLSGVPKT